MKSGKWSYRYTIQSLPSSSTYLSGFAVQNFASDVEPIKANEGHVGPMANQIPQFKDGNWIRFGSSYFEDRVGPGKIVKFQVVSPSPPGLVRCSLSGGELTLQGVGEHMPQELEAVIPGYEEWPTGYTIGPVDLLERLSVKQRAEYVLDKMPQLETVGWITPAVRSWYEKNLKGDIQAVLRRAPQDLDSEQISSEVFAMIQAIKN